MGCQRHRIAMTEVEKPGVARRFLKDARSGYDYGAIPVSGLMEFLEHSSTGGKVC